MDAKQYKEVEAQVPTIANYSKEVEVIEAFFEAKALKIEETTPIFWNHILTLFERIDEGVQNEFDLSEVDKMSLGAQEMTDEFEAFMKEERAFELTAFESYLVSLYFEQLIKGADENE